MASNVACTCSRHKIPKPVKQTEGKLDSHTEYSDHFLKFPITVTRGKPLPQELGVGGDFYCSTETREKYVLHQLQPRYKIVKPEYQPNPSKLDSSTTQRDNYQPWPGVTPPKRRQQPKYQSTPGTFDGTTTTKRDYVQFALPPHFVRQQQPYTKSPEKMDGISTQKEDFKRWSITSVPSRRKPTQAPQQQSEDRYNRLTSDFQSTTNSSYVTHKMTRELVKPPPNLTTDQSIKFDGSSTAKSAYLAWQLPPRYSRPRQVYNPTAAPLDTTTEYKNTFTSKSADRYIHPTPTYQPTGTKFEGTSTNKSDYIYEKVARVKDFAPRNTYVPKSDDRDFVSTTRGEYDPKPLPKCAASEWLAQQQQQQGSGLAQ